MSQIKPNFNIKASEVKTKIASFIESIKEQEKKDKLGEIHWDMFKKSDDLGNELSRYLSEISYLTSVTHNEELEKAYEESIPVLSKFYAEMGQDMETFNCLKKMRDLKNLDAIQKRILDKAIESYKLSGLTLSDSDKEKFNNYNERLSVLSNDFSKNVKNSTDSWSKHILDKKDLEGVSDVDLARFEQQAKDKELEGYLITLQIPDFMAVISYAESSSLREEMFRAYNTVASSFSNNGEYDNKPIIKEILSLRDKKSKLLGFKNYAELSLVRKMAETPEQVLDFLNDLSSKSKQMAKEERSELISFAKEELSIDDPKLWDLTLIARKHKEQKHNINLSEIKNYFPKSKVEYGLYWLIKELFDVDVEKVKIEDTYHDDVEKLKLSRDGKDIAFIYMDLYSRPGKRGGAWMNDFEHKMGNSLPIAFVTCNFPSANADEDALLSFDNVTTLFHEFGHALHHTLTTVEYRSAAGISGVPWDGVELPSTFMEFFCIQPEVIEKISSHHKTKETLPLEIIENMKKAENYYAANSLLRQMDLSISDMMVHLGEDIDINEVSKEFRKNNEMRPNLENTEPFNNFGHIFSGGYAAGYYSYKWADILSSDIFESFEEAGVLNKELAKKYLDEVLSKGGSDEMMTLFKNFKGREPSPNAFLKYQGIL